MFAILTLLVNRTPVAGEESATRRPNILWITCEDISPHLGCYGDRHAITPHLDRLAREGVRYQNAFSVAGVCAPTRSCIITGMYPSSIGSQHMRSRIVPKPPLRCFSEYLRDAGYYCTNNSKTDYNFEPPATAWDESSRKAHWKNRSPGQPFFAVFNLTVTHESQVRADAKTHAKNTAALTSSQRQDPRVLPLPPYYPDTPDVRREWAQNYELITAMDHRAGELLRELADAGIADETVVFFYSDHGVGLPRAKRWLYDSGLHVPFIVRWPGRLTPGTVESRLVSFVDLAPTVLSIAGIEIPPHLQGTPFLGSESAAPREYVYAARDRMDERYDVIRAVRDARFKYICNFRPDLPYAQPLEYAEVGGTMKEIRRLAAEGGLNPVQSQFLRETKPFEELYDVAADPHEIVNLAGSDDHQHVLERMRKEQARWSEETLDTGLLPEPELERLAGDVGIYGYLRAGDHSTFLHRLRIVATASADGSAESFSLLTAAVDDDEPSIRYWGALGLARFATTNKTVRAKLAAIAAADPSPSVRVAAAYAMCVTGSRSDGLRTLGNELRNPQASVRLLAANAIDGCATWGEPDDPRRELLPQFAAALEDDNGYVVRVMNRIVRELNSTADGSSD